MEGREGGKGEGGREGREREGGKGEGGRREEGGRMGGRVGGRESGREGEKGNLITCGSLIPKGGSGNETMTLHKLGSHCF